MSEDTAYKWHPEIVSFINRMCPYEPWNWADPESVDFQFQAIMKQSGCYVVRELNEIMLKIQPKQGCQPCQIS